LNLTIFTSHQRWKGENIILLSKSVNEDKQIEIRKLEINFQQGLFGNEDGLGEITEKKYSIFPVQV
jgi:hypothetical protein